MSNNHNPTKKVALITGASSGLGVCFAELLAAEGYDLMLVARREERLAALQEELSCNVETRCVDLANDEQVAALADELASRGDIHLLLNNAGFGVDGLVGEAPLEPQLAMSRVTLEAPLRLIHAVLPQMTKRGSGEILNIASIAAFFSRPRRAMYGATKAAMVVLTKILAAEKGKKGIRVTASCPGLIRTEFHGGSGMQEFDAASEPGRMWLTPPYVASSSLKALRRGKVVYVPSLRYKLLLALWRIPGVEYIASKLFG